jgi:hypothetical protein
MPTGCSVASDTEALRVIIASIRTNHPNASAVGQHGKGKKLSWPFIVDWIDSSGESAFRYKHSSYKAWWSDSAADVSQELVANMQLFAAAHMHFTDAATRLAQRNLEKSRTRSRLSNTTRCAGIPIASHTSTTHVSYYATCRSSVQHVPC